MLDGHGMGVGDWVFMSLFWIALVALVMLAVGRLSPSSGAGAPADQGPVPATPERLLDERLVRGEIDIETYERLRDVLAGRGRPEK
ncbi:SHOCT domain-containing protein [Miltoncostaea marina]|jgi:putative membrane protein|uniref:SHOCT domain-containing protein n=1 Tax=Miltoncostaea marina TaxID=2843215 RepID=UPI0031BAFC62